MSQRLHPSEVHASATAPSISDTVATSKSAITERGDCDSNAAIASPIVTSETRAPMALKA
ncbi:hypothetical protein DPMN_082139 [Dreissena polymorpha]|uniref:Uncharacterized protein n=1 Tax=Dreissena polymorpha TaxID=45954 RepID=A0A9D3Y6E7_DREPO|nr:hypothetical protein DPMN_082139 [Dreissena polymorpha]